MVTEAYVHGISTRSVDDLVVALGADSGISKSEVSRICEQLDESVGAFRTRPLDHNAFPYVYLDATYLHVRNKPGKGGQVVSMAVVVATGIAADGSREVLGLDVGDSEDETFWRAFLLSLKQRGLTGVQLVISDQHFGLVKALKRSFQGSAHQRCRVHFARNLLAHVAKSHADIGRRSVPHDLRPARPRGRQQGLGRGPRSARSLVPESRSTDGRGKGRGARLHRLPQGPLAQDLVDQPAI